MNKPFRKIDTGVIIYSILPNNMRVANVNDFKDKRGVEIVGTPFLVKSFHKEDYYELHYSKHGSCEKWKIWLEEDHIFVKK